MKGIHTCFVHVCSKSMVMILGESAGLIKFIKLHADDRSAHGRNKDSETWWLMFNSKAMSYVKGEIENKHRPIKIEMKQHCRNKQHSKTNTNASLLVEVKFL